MRPRRLLAIPLLLALVALALPASASHVGPHGQVALVAQDGETKTVALDALPPDVRDTTYTLRDDDGAETAATVAAGVSLSALLAAAGVAVEDFTYLQLRRGDGSTVLLLRDDVERAWAEGPPVFYEEAGTLRFLRPARAEADRNAADAVALPAAVEISRHTGTPYAVRIRASKRDAKPGERIVFEADLVVGERTDDVEFQWYFDGLGDRPVGDRVTRRFPRPDRYLVLVNVLKSGVKPDDIAPGRAVIRIARERPERERPRDRGETERDGGERNGGTGGTGGTGGSGTAGSGSGSSGSTGGAGTGGTSSRGGRSTARPRRSAPPAPVPDVVPTARGETVTGTLIASTAAVPPLPAGTPGRSAASAADGGTTTGPFEIPAVAYVAAGLLAIVALGWALESRYTVPHWQP